MQCPPRSQQCGRAIPLWWRFDWSDGRRDPPSFLGEIFRKMVVFYHALAGKIGAMLMLFDVKRQAKDSQSHVWGFLNEISGKEFWTYGNDRINQTARLSRFN